MKLADVEIGKEYLTRVSGELVKVKVQKRTVHHGFGDRAITKFAVVRSDNGRTINDRSPAALRPV